MRDVDFTRQLVAISREFPEDWEDAPRARAILDELESADAQTSIELIRELLQLLDSRDLCVAIDGIAGDAAVPEWIALGAIVVDERSRQRAWIIDIMPDPDGGDVPLLMAEWEPCDQITPLPTRDRGQGIDPTHTSPPIPQLVLLHRVPDHRLIDEPIADFEPYVDHKRVEPVAPPERTIERTPHLDVGEHSDTAVPVGSRFKVSVYLDTDAPLRGEEGASIVLPAQPELRLTVNLTVSSHFTIDGPSSGEILVEASKPRSSVATFDVTCERADDAQAGIAATFFYDWRPVGSVSRRLTIAGNGSRPADMSGRAQAPTTAPTSAVVVHTPTTPPDLTVTVRRAPDADERHYSVTICSPHLPRLVNGITVPWNLPSSTRDMVQRYMATFLTPDPGGSRAALRGSGRRLFDATPQEFQDAYWDLIDYAAANNVSLQTIFVVTDEPFIPWELMVPMRNGKFRSPLGVEFAVGRWVHPNQVSPRQKLPITDSWVIAPNYLKPDTLDFAAEETKFVIDNFNGERLTPAVILNIDEQLGARGASLLHFICHGISEPTVQILKLDPDEQLTDNEVEGLEGVAKAFHDYQPFVFINACQVGQINPALVGSTGFAAVFTRMEARGVVAPIWSVSDSVAADVARQFYTRIKADPTLPYAKVLQEIRKLAYEGQDPEDSYAAYCFYGDPHAAQTFPP